MVIYLAMAIELPTWAVKAIDKIRRSFSWRGRRDAKGGHCLIAWPKVCRTKELGGLGISDLKSLGIALRVRWPWLKKSEPDKPWASLPLQVSKEVEYLLSLAIITEVGDGANTLFWKGKWLAGRSIQDLAPNLYSLVPKRKANRRKVVDALVDENRVADIQGEISLEALWEYLDLWDTLTEVELQDGASDKHIWRLSSSGVYTTKSAYDALFEGAISFAPYEHI
ncbi:hypothetical protein PVAP13_7NG023489 [Panicum virgatum]|uniref:Uncharacterized protein n=1 Tax=Panicum virgatum TaxID=38727 RepID=A0A8T0PWK6_PANVG|nr:hypothetical protein PVAP13_7NG023489 [Panicum virgatum]